MTTTIVREKTRTLDFGKIDYYHTGRKINAVCIDVSLILQSDSKIRFSVSGAIYNQTKTDCLTAGQMLDNAELDELAKKHKSFAVIRKLWQKYHLNDMNAGTIKQEQALANAYKNGLLSKNGFDCDENCEYLKSINLYEDFHEGKLYRYGSIWFYRKIPDEALKQIHLILDTTKSIDELDNLL